MFPTWPMLPDQDCDPDCLQPAGSGQLVIAWIVRAVVVHDHEGVRVRIRRRGVAIIIMKHNVYVESM